MQIKNYETNLKASCNNCNGTGVKEFKEAFNTEKTIKVQCHICEGTGMININKKTIITMTSIPR